MVGACKLNIKYEMILDIPMFIRSPHTWYNF